MNSKKVIGDVGVIGFKASADNLDEKSRVVTGYLSSFDNIDSDKDIILKGAFAKSITENFEKLRFLHQHQWSQPLAKFSVLKEDSFGLYFETTPIPETTLGNDTITLYKSGIYDEHSIGFQVIKADYDSNTQIRNIKEVKLYEGSVVTLGANSNTPFMGFKGASVDQIEEEQDKIIHVIKKGGISPDMALRLEFAIKMLRKQAYLAGKNHSEPSKDTPEPMIEVETIKEFVNGL